MSGEEAGIEAQLGQGLKEKGNIFWTFTTTTA